MSRNGKDNKEKEILEKIKSGKINVEDLITTFPESHECPIDDEE